MTDTITAAEFEDRLVALCAGGRLTGLPRRQRDTAILLASATLWMSPGSVYTEREVNEALGRWLESGCPALSLDVVTLRRELVDRHYVDRDDSGRHYALASGPPEWRFEDGIGRLDPSAVLARARAEREERKRRHLGPGGR